MVKAHRRSVTIDKPSRYRKASRSAPHGLAKERGLLGQKVGRHWRLHREAVDAWLKNQPRERQGLSTRMNNTTNREAS